MTLFDRAPAALPPISDELILTGVACRVMDGVAPSLSVVLEPKRSVEINPACLVWKDETLSLLADTDGGVWVRGPGRVGLALGQGGQIFPLPLRRGESVQVRAGQFLMAAACERRPGQQRGLADRMSGGAGVAFDSFTAEDQGAGVGVASLGGVVERALSPGEVLELRPDAFLAKDDQVGLMGSIIGEAGDGEGFSWPCLRLTGAGRVALQTGTGITDRPTLVAEREGAKSRVFGIELPGWGRR